MPIILAKLAETMPGMPPQAWWLAPLFLLLLGVTAITDALKGRVPDAIIVPGIFAVTALQGIYVDWAYAGLQLTYGFAFAIALYLINQGWYRVMKRDALGMGDAKWTALAVTAFGVFPSAFAWFCGAIIAVAWIGVARIAGKKIQRVHFAPFLFVGLLAGIYLLRLR